MSVRPISLRGRKYWAPPRARVVAVPLGVEPQPIRPCGCGKPDCPTFMVGAETCRRLDGLRRRVLNVAGVVVPGLDAIAGY